MTSSRFQGLGWGIRHFPVLISGFPCNFAVKKPKGQLKVIQGSTGVKLPYLGSESHGGLNYKFHSYPISTSQVISFLRSIITFSGKKLLTLEGVTGGLSLALGLFSGSVSYIHCRNKKLMPPFIISRKWPISGLMGCFSKC